MNIEAELTKMYLKLKERQPDFHFKIVAHPNMLKAMGVQSGDKVTEYQIPIEADFGFQEIDIADNVYQSDIWVVGRPPKQRRKRNRAN